jgi:hypothetical protein
MPTSTGCCTRERSTTRWLDGNSGMAHGSSVARSGIVAIFLAGAVVGGAVTALLVQPKPGESFPIVFRGTTQGVTADGDGVAFYPNERYSEVFGTFPGFEVSGENRTSAVPAEICLVPGTAEQDVVFAVVDLDGARSLAWYACLTEGTTLNP